MENIKLTINLVTWNGEKYIPFLFESLSKQTNKNWDLMIVDNASSDKMVEIIEKGAGALGVPYKIIRNQKNSGFAGGHNQAYKESGSDYFLIINQDLYLKPDCIEKMIKFLDANPKVVAVAPRAMKWHFSENKFTNIIDSLGLYVACNRRVVEIGEGQEYKNNITGAQSVFGVSGAIAMFRRVAIDQLDYFFDEDFQSYKEDVDLSYRLNALGGEIFVLSDAVAYHDRAGSGVKQKDDLSSALNKANQKSWVRFCSYKNHLAVLYKNEYWQNFIIDLPWILWYELKKFIYFILFDRAVLRGILELWSGRRAMVAKRAQIVKSRQIDWRQMRRKMFGR